MSASASQGGHNEYVMKCKWHQNRLFILIEQTNDELCKVVSAETEKQMQIQHINFYFLQSWWKTMYLLPRFETR